MNRRHFLQSGAAAAASLLLAGPGVLAAEPQPRRPNIIYILADDLGYGDLGCYGQQKALTPSLDRMATEGLRFTDHYAGAPLCAPSRCVLLTGKHTGHARIRDNAGAARNTLAAEDTTVAEVLKAAGYATACIGKWGQGKFGTTGDPAKRGFEHFFGYVDQGDAHFYYPAKLQRDGKDVAIEANADGKQGAYAHDLFTQDALRYIGEKRDRPFFLFLAYTIPHAELLVPEDSLKPYAGKWEEKPFKKGHYGAQPQPRAARAAMITCLDRDVGLLLEKLKSLGLDQNTLVIFTSDNGPAVAGGADPAFFKSTGPLKGLKFGLNEGGIRVPMIARWPGMIAKGKTTNVPSAFWDILPTFAELAGAKTPAGLDGVSILPTLLGQPDGQKAREYLYWEYNGFQAVRFGQHKALRKFPGPPAIYDLKADLGETTDIAAQRPDLVRQAQKYMEAAHVDDPNWPLAPATKPATRTKRPEAE